MNRLAEFIRATAPKTFARRTLAILLVGTFCAVAIIGAGRAQSVKEVIEVLKVVGAPVSTVVALYFMARASNG